MVWYVRTIRGAAPRLGLRGTLTELRKQDGLGRFILGFHLLSLTSPLAYLVARVQILSHYGAAGTGLFAAAYGLAVAMRVVLNQANGLYLMPIVNRSSAKTDRARATGEYLRVLVVMLALPALAIVLFGHAWMVLLYSREFAGATAMLGVFVAGEAMLLFAGVYRTLLIGFDDLRAHLVISVIANGVVAAGAWLLVGPLGPAGAGYAFLGAHTIILVGSAWRLKAAHHAGAATRPLPRVLTTVATVFGAAIWVTSWEPGVIWRVLLYALLGLAFASLLSPAERRWLLAPWTGMESRERS